MLIFVTGDPDNQRLEMQRDGGVTESTGIDL